MSNVLATFILFLPRSTRFRYVSASVGVRYGHIFAMLQLRMSAVLPVFFPSNKFKAGSGHVSPIRATSLLIDGMFQTIAAWYESIKGAPDLKSLSVYNMFAALHILEISLLNM